MYDFDKYKSELDNLYTENQILKSEFDYIIEISQLPDQDRQVLQEMHFTKKDLQDPETIKKIENILNRTRYVNIVSITAIISLVLPVVISVIVNPSLIPAAIIAGFALLGTTLALLGDWAVNAPRKSFEKNYEKYKKQVKELKEKTENKLAKKENSKYASEYKKIIANCDKVLKAIDEREKQIEKTNNEKLYKAIKTIYEKFVKFLDCPYNFGFQGENKGTDIVNIAKALGISEDKMMARMKKIKYKDYTLEDAIMDFYGSSYKSFEEIQEKEELNLNGCNIKTKVQQVCFNDDYYSYIGEDGRFYVIWYDDNVNKESFYKFFNVGGSVDFNDSKVKEYLKEVDKELGYYILSNPPKNLDKKKLPL